MLLSVTVEVMTNLGLPDQINRDKLDKFLMDIEDLVDGITGVNLKLIAAKQSRCMGATTATTVWATAGTSTGDVQQDADQTG